MILGDIINELKNGDILVYKCSGACRSYMPEKCNVTIAAQIVHIYKTNDVLVRSLGRIDKTKKNNDRKCNYGKIGNLIDIFYTEPIEFVI